MESASRGVTGRPVALRPTPTARAATGLSAVAYWGVLAALLALGLALRVWQLGAPDLWTDEVLSALRARAPLDDALNNILSVGNQAPLYYLGMRLLPHDSALWLRLPAVVLGLVNVVQLALLVEHIYGDRRLALHAPC
jgi:hypothetical protein